MEENVKGTVEERMAGIREKDHYSYEDFLEIIGLLRSEDGCPWDREQTHVSLRPCMTEEAAEVLAAIRIYDQTGSYENLREELGDVLLQVVMHSRIAEEEGLFTMEDVVSEVAEKMVRRHPHVFGKVTANDSGQALERWEEIKKKEKEGVKDLESPLRSVPKELPALMRAPKVLKKADRLYGTAQQDIPAEEKARRKESQLRKAAKELKEAAEKLSGCVPSNRDPLISGLVGDVLMAVSEVSRICDLPQEQILNDRIEEVIERHEKP